MIFIKQSTVTVEMKNSSNKLGFDLTSLFPQSTARSTTMNTLAAKSVPILPKPIPPYSAINPTQNIFAYPLYLSMYNIYL